jgi:hypothetical protein
MMKQHNSNGCGLNPSPLLTWKALLPQPRHVSGGEKHVSEHWLDTIEITQYSL